MDSADLEQRGHMGSEVSVAGSGEERSVLLCRLVLDVTSRPPEPASCVYPLLTVPTYFTLVL